MLQLESTKLPFDIPDQGGEGRALLLCSVFSIGSIYWQIDPIFIYTLFDSRR